MEEIEPMHAVEWYLATLLELIATHSIGSGSKLFEEALLSFFLRLSSATRVMQEWEWSQASSCASLC